MKVDSKIVLFDDMQVGLCVIAIFLYVISF